MRPCAASWAQHFCDKFADIDAPCRLRVRADEHPTERTARRSGQGRAHSGLRRGAIARRRLCCDVVNGACVARENRDVAWRACLAGQCGRHRVVQITPKMVAEWEYVGPSERCGPNWRSKLAGPNTSLLYRTTLSEPTGSAQPLLVSLTIPRPANGTVLEVC